MNITELRDHHIDNVYKKLITKALKPSEAKEANNAIGKVMQTVKAELEFFALRKEAPEIPFIRPTTKQ